MHASYQMIWIKTFFSVQKYISQSFYKRFWINMNIVEEKYCPLNSKDVCYIDVLYVSIMERICTRLILNCKNLYPIHLYLLYDN